MHTNAVIVVALSAPAGRTCSGLPVGLQVIGPRYEDDTAIKFAELLADIVGGYERPPL
jgi:amidase